MTHQHIRTKIVRIGDTIARLVRQRQKYLVKRTRLNRLYAAAIRRRDAKAMARYDERICQLHQYELGPLNEKIARREGDIRILQHQMTGN